VACVNHLPFRPCPCHGLSGSLRLALAPSRYCSRFLVRFFVFVIWIFVFVICLGLLLWPCGCLGA
jgi:hypothetical protein